MTKLLQGRCANCGGPLEFPAEAIGSTADCPHCRKSTELRLATPPQEPTVPVKTIVYTAIAILILIGGLVAAMIALKHAQVIKEQKSPSPGAVAP